MQAGSWRHFESLRKVSPLSGLASCCEEHCSEFVAFAFVTFFVKLYYQIICDQWILIRKFSKSFVSFSSEQFLVLALLDTRKLYFRPTILSRPAIYKHLKGLYIMAVFQTSKKDFQLEFLRMTSYYSLKSLCLYVRDSGLDLTADNTVLDRQAVLNGQDFSRSGWVGFGKGKNT